MKKAILLILLFITACKSANREISILDESSCSPPCWNSIIPGETSHSEVLQIVKNLNEIDSENVVDTNIPWKIFNKQIWFYLYKNSSQVKVQTDGAVYFLDDKVVALFLQRNIGRTFSEMIEIAGEPEAIISMSFAGVTVIRAIDSSKGIVFESYVDSDQLHPETRIDNVMFFDTTHYEELLDAEMFSMGSYDAKETKKIMYPWKGYGNIEELYPPRSP